LLCQPVPHRMPDRTPPRVLVIDDEHAVRATLCATLSDAGCEVMEARDGAEAIEILRTAPTDAVLMDIYMPMQDGFEAIRALRRIAPAVKIIAISGGSRGSFDPLKAAQMLGADRTLRKPFGIDDLLAAVTELLPGISEK